MFLVSKDKNSIVNMLQMKVVYLGSDNCTIKADYQNGKGCQLGGIIQKQKHEQQ